MSVRSGTILVLCLALMAGIGYTETETLQITSLEGEVMVHREGAEPVALTAGDTLMQGDRVELADGAMASFEFADGATADVTGPALLDFREVRSTSRYIDLRYGSINRLVTRSVQTGVWTPWDATLVTGNSTTQVRIDPTADGASVTFMLIEGEGETSVVERESGRITPLTTDGPLTIDRVRPRDETAPERDPEMMARGGEKFVIGAHVVEIIPADGFEKVPMTSGGMILRSIVPEGEFGVVIVDNTTEFYLATGEEIEFDASGNVVRYTGISHVYAALDQAGIYDEAVADPSDTSPIGR